MAVLFAMLGGVTGCAGTPEMSAWRGSPSAVPVSVAPYTDSDPKTIPGRIKRLEALLAAEDKGSDKARAETLITLAMLYAHHDNPAPDYGRARECITAYAELRDWVDVHYAGALLETLAAGENGTKDCDRLVTDYSALKARYERLEQEDRKHREMIEKLKHLDLQLEERRERIK
ncbi:MAG: hypothetical protein SWH61_10700 [Thermodesulfobacteriota bacterium]|nr:hypothetical protein [Thermodesulfobacteriota bacterium]